MGNPVKGFGRKLPLGRVGAGSYGNDGVDRQVHLPHDARVVCAGPGQPHRRDLDYAGVARHRPDDEPGPDHHHLSRHHQPGDSGACAGHRADRADDCDLAYAEQARHRFRNHRDECRRLFPLPAVPPIFLRHVCGGAPGHLHCGLSRSRRPAPDQAMGRRDHGRRADQHPAARTFRPARPEPDDSESGNGSRAASSPASSSTTAAIPRSASPSSPTMARC